MTDAERLQSVKTRLSITDDYQDELIGSLIDEVMLYMLDAGIAKDVLNSTASVGAIARGVSDTWYYNKFSNAFYQRIEQLRHCEVTTNERV